MSSFIRKLFSGKYQGDENKRTNEELPEITQVNIESDSGHSSENAISIEFDDSVKHRLAELIFSNCLDTKNFRTYYDELLPEAAKLVVEAQTGSTSILQRKLTLGYNRAGRIIDQLEQLQIVGPFLGSEPRKVQIKSKDELEKYLQLIYGSFKTYYHENKPEIDALVRQLENAAEIETSRQKESERIKEIENQKLKLIEQNQKKAIKQEAFRQIISEILVARKIKDQNGNEILLPDELGIKVWQKYNGKLANCGIGEKVGVEPIILPFKSNDNSLANLQLLCNTCSVIKSIEKL